MNWFHGLITTIRRNDNIHSKLLWQTTNDVNVHLKWIRFSIDWMRTITFINVDQKWSTENRNTRTHITTKIELIRIVYINTASEFKTSYDGFDAMRTNCRENATETNIEYNASDHRYDIVSWCIYKKNRRSIGRNHKSF